METLPNETLCFILSLLNAFDIGNVSCVSRRFHNVVTWNWDYWLSFHDMCIENIYRPVGSIKMINTMVNRGEYLLIAECIEGMILEVPKITEFQEKCNMGQHMFMGENLYFTIRNFNTLNGDISVCVYIDDDYDADLNNRVHRKDITGNVFDAEQLTRDLPEYTLLENNMDCLELLIFDNDPEPTDFKIDSSELYKRCRDKLTSFDWPTPITLSVLYKMSKKAVSGYIPLSQLVEQQ